MSETSRKVEVSESFIKQLAAFEKFLGRNSQAVGRAFTAAVFDFCYDILAPMPWAYPAFQDGETIRPAVRRAVFKRQYVLLYRITDATVQMLDIFHTSQQNQHPTNPNADE